MHTRCVGSDTITHTRHAPPGLATVCVCVPKAPFNERRWRPPYTTRSGLRGAKQACHRSWTWHLVTELASLRSPWRSLCDGSGVRRVQRRRWASAASRLRLVVRARRAMQHKCWSLPSRAHASSLMSAGWLVMPVWIAPCPMSLLGQPAVGGGAAFRPSQCLYGYGVYVWPSQPSHPRHQLGVHQPHSLRLAARLPVWSRAKLFTFVGHNRASARSQTSLPEPSLHASGDSDVLAAVGFAALDTIPFC